MKKVYIAGKVTGIPHDEAIRKFALAATLVKDAGFEPVNPMEVVNDANASWSGAMKLCIKALMDCDAVFLLPCHWSSTGAKEERRLAIVLGIPTSETVHGLQ